MRVIFLILCFSIPLFANSNLYPIKIGFLSATKGVDPNTSIEMERGMRVFFEINPVWKQRFDVKIYTTNGTVEDAFIAANTANSEGRKILVGISRSDEALAISKAALENNQIYFAPLATNDRVTQNMPNTFRITFSDSSQGEYLAQFTKEKLRPSKVVILTNRDILYSVGLSDIFLKNIESKKNISKKQIIYSSEKLLLPEQVEEVVGFKPDVIFLPDYSDRSAAIVNELFKKIPKVIYLGGDGWGGKRLFHSIFPIQSQAQLIYSNHWDAEVKKNKKSVKFVNIYKKLYPDSEPTTGAALIYDAFSLFSQSISESKIKSLDIDKIKTQLFLTRYHGATGLIEYKDKNNPTPKKRPLMMHLKNQKYIPYEF